VDGRDRPLVTAAWKDIAAGDASWSFTLEKYAPNVYVTAFVIKDRTRSPRMRSCPTRVRRRWGARRAVAATQAVQLTAPREVRSSSPLSITLDAGKLDGPAFATVAVVDEGILSLTGFASPDPLAQLFAKRALGVETYETIGWTCCTSRRRVVEDRRGDDRDGDGIPMQRTGRSVPGPAGQAGRAVLRRGRGRRRRQADDPVPGAAVPRRAAGDGSGRDPARVGRAEAHVTVKDPLVLQVTFPRFITQNDEVQIPVFMTNLSGGPLEVTVALSSEPLAIPRLAAPRTAAPRSASPARTPAP